MLGVKNFYFLNMVMGHIKLNEMISRPRYTEKLYPRIKLVTLSGVNRSNIIRFFRTRWDLRRSAIECVLVIYLSMAQKSGVFCIFGLKMTTSCLNYSTLI